MDVQSAIKANNGRAIVLVHPWDKKPHNGLLRMFLKAMGLMGLKKGPPKYWEYYKNLTNGLRSGHSPVFVITNSRFSIPLWLIGLKADRTFILVDSISNGDPTPVINMIGRFEDNDKKVSNKVLFERQRRGWKAFSSLTKRLGVKSFVVWGEVEGDCCFATKMWLKRYYGVDKVQWDGNIVFPPDKRMNCPNDPVLIGYN